ncbi:hypothetical protein NUACC21_78300 [Scytonema sp. NUACC21]
MFDYLKVKLSLVINFTDSIFQVNGVGAYVLRTGCANAECTDVRRHTIVRPDDKSGIPNKQSFSVITIDGLTYVLDCEGLAMEHPHFRYKKVEIIPTKTLFSQ